MKKITSILIILMLMISISLVVLADDVEEDDDGKTELGDGLQTSENETEESDEGIVDYNTEQETEIMNNVSGAEIRLLQLKKVLLKNILIGEMAVEVLKGLEYDTSKLEIILTEMKVLLDVVNDTDPAADDSVEIFVQLKYEAKNYTRQFRETIKELLDEVKLKELREMIRARFSEEELEGLSKIIRNRIRQFNRNRIFQLYGIIGEVDNSFAEEYMNGSISLDQVKIRLCKMINEMKKENRYNAFLEIKGENIKRCIHAKSVIDEMKSHGNGNGRWG